ncbi:hypothetical protein ACIOJE_07770 [Kitasatospora sp. NPDC087861]|uniref:hypothetical protein n=1 Tax=Kitasatospora sp. NPDC087861 TaxID=3364070 RepID=UPI00381429DF
MTGYYASLEIRLALDNARELIEAELTESENYKDLMDLFTAAFKAALRDPEVEFEAVVLDAYGAKYGPREVRTWWNGWK